MAGGGKAKAMAPLIPPGVSDSALIAPYCSSGFLRFGPVFEGDEEEGAVRVLHLAQHVVADHGGDVLDAGDIHDQVFGLAGDIRGALQRAGIGS